MLYKQHVSYKSQLFTSANYDQMHLAATYPPNAYGSSKCGLSHTMLLHFGLVLRLYLPNLKICQWPY